MPSKVLGRGAFQDLDLTGAFADVALTSRTIYAESNHAEMVSRAAKAAIEQRGVAHLVLPDEVQVLPAADGATPGAPVGRMADRAIRPPEGVLNEALNLLDAAKRPVIILGHGARGAVGDITALAERLGAPIITTFKAKGLVPDDHPLAGGALGRSGTPIASWLMNESDLLLVFGASFSDHTGISPYTPIIQVDDQPASLGRFQPVTVPVLGDTGETARLMLAGLADAIAAVDQRADVAARHAIWRAEKQRRAGDDRGLGVASAAIFAALADAVAADAVIAVDVGNNTYSFGRYFECRRQVVVMSGYLGSIGFALPAAMGAWAAVQGDGSGRQVVAVAGDGGFGQYMGELTTAVKYGMNITIVLLNNGQLGKISKEQRAAELDVWQTSLHNPDFAAYAQLCGARGERVSDPTRLAGALADALAHDGPALVEIISDPELV